MVTYWRGGLVVNQQLQLSANSSVPRDHSSSTCHLLFGILFKSCFLFVKKYTSIVRFPTRFRKCRGVCASWRPLIQLDTNLNTILEDDDFQPVVPGGTQIKKNWEEEDKPEVEAPASWEDADEEKVIFFLEDWNLSRLFLMDL